MQGLHLWKKFAFLKINSLYLLNDPCIVVKPFQYKEKNFLIALNCCVALLY